MSSSKIYKQDPAFMPITLVQEEITRNNHQDIPDKAETAEDLPVDEDALSMEEAEHALEEQAEPTPEIDEQQQQQDLDIQAIREEAYNLGVADTTARYQTEIQSAVDALDQACQKIDSLHQALLEKCRGDIINTVIALSRKIIGQELATKRDVIANTLENALEQAIASEEFVITVHPEDLHIVEEMKADLISRARGLDHIVLRTDQKVHRGGCLLESKTCSIDATIESQLESAREFLEENTLSLDQRAAEPSTAVK